MLDVLPMPILCPKNIVSKSSLLELSMLHAKAVDSAGARSGSRGDENQISKKERKEPRARSWDNSEEKEKARLLPR